MLTLGSSLLVTQKEFPIIFALEISETTGVLFVVACHQFFVALVCFRISPGPYLAKKAATGLWTSSVKAHLCSDCSVCPLDFIHSCETVWGSCFPSSLCVTEANHSTWLQWKSLLACWYSRRHPLWPSCVAPERRYLKATLGNILPLLFPPTRSL